MREARAAYEFSLASFMWKQAGGGLAWSHVGGCSGALVWEVDRHGVPLQAAQGAGRPNSAHAVLRARILPEIWWVVFRGTLPIGRARLGFVSAQIGQNLTKSEPISSNIGRLLPNSQNSAKPEPGLPSDFIDLVHFDQSQAEVGHILTDVGTTIPGLEGWLRRRGSCTTQRKHLALETRGCGRCLVALARIVALERIPGVCVCRHGGAQ